MIDSAKGEQRWEETEVLSWFSIILSFVNLFPCGSGTWLPSGIHSLPFSEESIPKATESHMYIYPYYFIHTQAYVQIYIREESPQANLTIWVTLRFSRAWNTTFIFVQSSHCWSLDVPQTTCLSLCFLPLSLSSLFPFWRFKCGFSVTVFFLFLIHLI